MAEIIPLHTASRARTDNRITTTPFEFRRPGWDTVYFAQMSRSRAARLEGARQDTAGSPGGHAVSLPEHFTLKGGLAHTIRSLYAHRDSGEAMREVYYLIGLMDCMINQVNPVLRTDLLHGVYKTVFSLKKKLNVFWYGRLDQVLLPIEPRFYNEREYHASLARACSLKELYLAIRRGTDAMFGILGIEYVFYCPSVGGMPWKRPL